MIGDRIFGLVMIFLALGYILSATGIQTSFLSDPVGPKAFPYMIAGVTILCGLSMIYKPDPDVDWPVGATLVNLVVALAVLIIYALTIRPLGFIAPTCVASAILAYQISHRLVPSVLAGLGLGIGLFVVFKFVLGLGLFAFPRGMLG